MSQDYPASHSMDTCWFAVDKDGHVAVFDTGEAGALPDCAQIDDPYRLRDELVRRFPNTGSLLDPDGRQLPGPVEEGQEAGPEHRWLGDRDADVDHVLMFLDSLDPVRDELARGLCIELPARRGVAVYFPSVPRAVVTRLHRGRRCRGCYYYYRADPAESEMEDYERAAAHGFFEYGHLCENWVAGPYGREEVPAKPVHIDQLPPRLRDAVRAMTFPNLSFAETPHIQPIEHTPCSAWDNEAYRTVDGRTLPMPGADEG